MEAGGREEESLVSLIPKGYEASEESSKSRTREARIRCRSKERKIVRRNLADG